MDRKRRTWMVRIALLWLASSAPAFARLSENSPPYGADYDDLRRLEAYGCAYPTYRATAPQGHSDLGNAIYIPKEKDEDVDVENPVEKPDPCKAPEWLRKERAFLLRPMLANELRIEGVWMRNDAIPLLGTEATVTPLFDQRENRTTFNGPNLYTELSVAGATNYGDFGFAAGATPGWVGALDNQKSFDGRVYLHEGYLKVGYRWAEVTFGRTALRFGQTEHGSLLFSASSDPIDLLKFSIRPHILASWLDFLGPVTFDTFFTPPLHSAFVNNARLFGVQLGLRPISWLEIAFLELNQFGGDGVAGLSFSDFLRMAAYSGSADLDNRRNRSFGTDIAFWLPSKSARLYTQLYFDALEATSKWFSDDISYLTGLWIPRLGPLDVRFEYVHTVQNAYRSKLYGQGLTYEGSPLGHPLGPDAEGAYFDLGLPAVFGDWRPTLGALYEGRALHASALAPAEEIRYGGTFGIKKRWQLVELDAQVAYHLIKNALYQPGPDTNSVAGYLALRYSFY